MRRTLRGPWASCEGLSYAGRAAHTDACELSQAATKKCHGGRTADGLCDGCTLVAGPASLFPWALREMSGQRKDRGAVRG